ncbi:MAG: phytanoyl-CoA dioxygenase family protein [Candidatus Latescibacteria bacterium]|nr:phytanoyl-CoA dioxygenase family protein [Candidatus Latescibacterota bacterium]
MSAAEEVACRQLETQGYTVLEGLLEEEEAARLDARARELMADRSGYAKLEGALNFIPALAPLCMHPAVLRIAGRFLGAPFYLVNNVCMMWCQPGAPGGRLHADWPLGDVPRPYPPWPLLLQTMWMLTDFTAENGATRLVPGTHRSGQPPPSTPVEGEVAATGRRGAVLIWHGATWHRNGPNTTPDQHRMGANAAYIPRFVHRPELWPRVRREIYQRLPEPLQKLLERSVEPVG